MFTRIFIFFTLCLFGLTGNTFSSELTVGSLTISKPTLRATPPSAKVGAGYLLITNNGGEDDMLIGLNSSFSKMAQIHSMKIEDGVMKMERIEDGIAIPAGTTITLKPGGNHLMFMGIQEPFIAGQNQKITLTFEKAGTVEVDFAVRSIPETMKLFE